MSDRPIFPLIGDARDWYGNSGYFDWKWWPEFQESDLIQFAYDYADAFTQVDDEWHDDQLVAAFLLLHGQDPGAYRLTANEQTVAWVEAKRAAYALAARHGRADIDARARAARQKNKRGR